MSRPYNKILLPLDGSEFSAAAIPHAEAIASTQDAQLILFQVVEDPPSLMATAPGMGAASDGHTSVLSLGYRGPESNAHVAAMDEAASSLEEVAASLGHRHIKAIIDIDTGDPASCIVDYASKHGVDLIVMNTHGRTGVKRLAYGSVTNKVLQSAPCSVLVVRER